MQTRDLRDTGAMLYQLSYEATHWERGQFIELISSRNTVSRVSSRISIVSNVGIFVVNNISVWQK